MTKIDIFSGFLGAGKTTLIKKLIKEAFTGEKLVLIENEFGEIGIDGGFMQDAGIEVTEMNSGCICCSLVGDFSAALKKVLDEFKPDRILIEPSGVGKLSDVIKAAGGVHSDSAKLNSFSTVADAHKCKMYMKNFGEFYNDQIANASCIFLSRTEGMSREKIDECVALLREHNKTAQIVTTPWTELDGKVMLEAMENTNSLEDELKRLAEEADICPECGHHHGHGEHHHHDHDEHCCHDHDHHHHHHADDVFTSWGVETAHVFTKAELEEALGKFAAGSDYGAVLRAKGIVSGGSEGWLHFDYVPGESDIRSGSAAVIGRICVIGSSLDKDKIAQLFGVGGAENE